jgi:hypothetical protein
MAQGPARADTISALISADNHFAFYVGDATGSNLTYIGRNMTGGGDDNGYNWQQAVTFSGVTIKPGQYLYVVAWNLDGPQMWIGEFTKSDGTKLYSNTSDWVYKVGSGDNPGDDGNLVDSRVQQDIAAGVWATPLVQASNGADPWGNLDAFSSSANYVWHDTLSLDGDESSSQSSYAIFRTAAPVTHTPVPPTVLLLGSGLVGLGLLRGKRGLKQ